MFPWRPLVLLMAMRVTPLIDEDLPLPAAIRPEPPTTRCPAASLSTGEEKRSRGSLCQRVELWTSWANDKKEEAVIRPLACMLPRLA